MGGETEGIKTPVHFWGHLGFMTALIILQWYGGASTWCPCCRREIILRKLEIPDSLFIYLFTHLFISGFGLLQGEHNIFPKVGGEERQRSDSVQAGDISWLVIPPFCPQHFTCLHFAIWKMAEKKWAAVKCTIQHPPDHCCFLIGVLVGRPPFQKQIFFHNYNINTHQWHGIK